MLSHRSPKPIFLTYGPILPAIAKTPRTAWNKRSMTLARLSPKPFARPFPPRPHNPPASFLDADPLSQLHRRLSARDGSPSGCRRSPRKKGYSAHPANSVDKATARSRGHLNYQLPTATPYETM